MNRRSITMILKVLLKQLPPVMFALLILGLTSCASNDISWEQLQTYDRMEYEVTPERFVIVLPAKNHFDAYAAFAKQNWPDVPVITDTQLLNEGPRPKQNLLIIGTAGENRAIANVTGDDIAAQLLTGDDAICYVKYPSDRSYKIVILTALVPEAILKAANIPKTVQNSPYQVSIIKDRQLAGGGYVPPKTLADNNSFLLSNSDLRVVVPSDSDQLIRYQKFASQFGAPAVPDALAVLTPWKYPNIMVIGTPDNNPLLKMLLAETPVKFDRQGAITGKTGHAGAVVFYGKGPRTRPGQSIRILAANDEQTLLNYRFRYSDRNLAYCDYEIINSATNTTLEAGDYLPDRRHWAQSAPQTPKDMMLEDYDYLTQFIKDYLPNLTLNQKVYGIDIAEKLFYYRAQITGNETPAQFAAIIAQALQACKASHLELGWDQGTLTLINIRNGVQGYTSPKNQWFIYGETPSNLIDIHRRYKYQLNQLYRNKAKIPRGLPLIYLDGEYYTANSFRYQNADYPSGLKLLSVNRQTPAELQKKYEDQLCDWDSVHQRFYGQGGNSKAIYETLIWAGERYLSFEFADFDGNQYYFVYDSQDEVIINNSGRITNFKSVIYWPDRQILYLRQAQMSPPDKLLQELHELGPMPGLKAVIWDIRNNPGGIDSAWGEVLGSMISTPTQYTFRLGRRTNGFNNELFGRVQYCARVNYLDEEEFGMTDSTWHIRPNKDSLALDVPIYILTEHVSSAAGKLFVFATNSDQLITIGGRNSYPCGEGGAPFYMLLPNSKLMVRYKLYLNLNGAKNAGDLLNAVPEIELEMSAAEYFRNQSSTPATVSRSDYLLHHDLYMQKVLQRIDQGLDRKPAAPDSPAAPGS